MPAIDQKVIVAWVQAVAASYGRVAGDINYVFVNDEEILRVNRQFLGHDYYTDIITFDNGTAAPGTSHTALLPSSPDIVCPAVLPSGFPEYMNPQ